MFMAFVTVAILSAGQTGLISKNHIEEPGDKLRVSRRERLGKKALWKWLSLKRLGTPPAIVTDRCESYIVFTK